MEDHIVSESRNRILLGDIWTRTAYKENKTCESRVIIGLDASGLAISVLSSLV